MQCLWLSILDGLLAHRIEQLSTTCRIAVTDSQASFDASNHKSQVGILVQCRRRASPSEVWLPKRSARGGCRSGCALGGWIMSSMQIPFLGQPNANLPRFYLRPHRPGEGPGPPAIN